MVGAIWIDSGSDSETDAATHSPRRQRSSKSVGAIARPSRLDAWPQQRRSPRRSAAAPPSSSSSIIALPSSQDLPQHATAAKTYLPSKSRTTVLDSSGHLAAAAELTPGQRMAHLLAEPSPDTSLPSFRDLIRQHKSRSTVVASAIDDTVPSATRLAPATSCAGSLRRTASQPAASSSQELPTSSHFRASVRRPSKKPAGGAQAEVIEIGSDSILDEVDAALALQTSSPIRSQFSARQQLSSSQPLPFSPPRTRGAPRRAGETRTSGLQGSRTLLRADSAPIVILSSSPPPQASLPRASQRSLGHIIEDIAEEGNDSPDLPPSSFPFDDPPPSPPFSPIGAPLDTAVDLSPSLKRRAVESTHKPLTPKRTKTLQRTTSLLEALDSLHAAEDTDMPKQGTARDAAASDRDGNGTKAAKASPSPKKAQKAAAAKEAREAKAREREAAKAAKLRAAADKKRFLEVNRLRTSKSETMRELIVDLDRTLFSAGQPFAGCQESIQARFEEEGASVHLCDGVVAPPLVRFRRKLKAEWDAQRRHWVPLDREMVKREAMVIVYVDAKVVVQLVTEGGEEGLESWYDDLKRRLVAMDGGEDQQVFLICQGLVKHYNKLKANENRAYTAKIRQQLDQNQQTSADPMAVSDAAPTAPPRRKATGDITDSAVAPQSLVERSLLQLKLVHRCYVIHAGALVDGIEWLHQLTSDLSLKPYKTLRDTHLSFAVDTGRNTTSSSSADIYSMMLQQIPRVTPAIANSITTIYPSLNALISAYERCRDEQEEKGLLSGVQVQSNKDGTERRVNRMNLGLQLSKRVQAVVRGRNGELLVSNPTKD